jgi:lipid II:glycine glycyltransferase (peptidoglycan interpeptide bridge formation enzyme)
LKYNINKISNKTEIKNIYLNFIKFSPQKNIFCSQEILEYFFEELDLYTVSKSDKIKSFVYLHKNNDNFLVAEPFIYSGIINHPQQEMKSARYNNEVFKINELIVNEIFSKYKKINLNLPLNFIDTRPFLWFNYGKAKEKNFLVTPCYTSIIDIKSKDKEKIFNEIDDVKKRDIKKVLSNKDYRVSGEIELNLLKKFYEKTMENNNGEFDNKAYNKIFDFIEKQNNKGKVTQVTTHYLEKPIYSVLFLNDDVSSCYLYGSGDIESKNRYAGSLALWKAIEKSLDLKLSYIDLEGINSPYRGEYKLNFGGNIQNYYNINL